MTDRPQVLYTDLADLRRLLTDFDGIRSDDGTRFFLPARPVTRRTSHATKRGARLAARRGHDDWTASARAIPVGNRDRRRGRRAGRHHGNRSLAWWRLHSRPRDATRTRHPRSVGLAGGSFLRLAPAGQKKVPRELADAHHTEDFLRVSRQEVEVNLPKVWSARCAGAVPGRLVS